MPRRWNFAPIVWCGILAGCASGPSFDIPAGSPEEPVLNGEMRLEYLRTEIDATPLGSQVNCVNESKQSISGTLLSKGRNQIELVNCLCQEAIPGPDGNMQAKQSHQPWRAIEVSSLTHFSNLSPLQRNQTQRKLAEEIPRPSVNAIILKGGRRRPVPRPVGTIAGRDSRQTIQELIAIAPRGSEIRVVDEENRPYQGILSSKDSEGIHLVNCVFAEHIPGRDDQTQCKTSYVAFHSFTLASIKSLEVLSPPPAGFVPPTLDDNCEEFCADVFVYADGRHQRRGEAPTWDRAPQDGE